MLLGIGKPTVLKQHYAKGVQYSTVLYRFWSTTGPHQRADSSWLPLFFPSLARGTPMVYRLLHRDEPEVGTITT